MVSHQPMSTTSSNHFEDKPSTNKNKVQGKKEKMKFPYMLCMGDNLTLHCPLKVEVSQLLEARVITQ